MKTSDNELETVLNAVAGYFAVLAEPTRLRVLRALCGGERTVGRIVKETGVSQSTVSRHLAVLHRHGIAARRRGDRRQVVSEFPGSGPDLVA